MKIFNALFPNFFSGKKLKAQDIQALAQHLRAWAADLAVLHHGDDHYGLVYDHTLPNQGLLLHGKTLEVHDLAALSPSGMPILVKRNHSPALYLELPERPSQQNVGCLYRSDE